MPAVATSISLTILAIAALLAFVRVWRGPTLPDRVVAIDLIGVIIVGVMVVDAAASGERASLDVAIVMALISFVGTVAYARYVERQEST